MAHLEDFAQELLEVCKNGARGLRPVREVRDLDAIGRFVYCISFVLSVYSCSYQFQVVMLHEKDSARWRTYLEGLMFLRFLTNVCFK